MLRHDIWQCLAAIPFYIQTIKFRNCQPFARVKCLGKDCPIVIPKQKISHNTLFNFLGQSIPFIVGFFAIPLLIKNLGVERFGILTVVWALIGYFSLFDFGLSRVITYKVSDMFRTGNIDELPIFFWSSLMLILIFTFIGSTLLIIISCFPSLFSSQVGPESLNDGIASLRLIAVGLPAITITAGFKGLLEAEHRFLELNILQAFQGIFTFLIPLFISYFSSGLIGPVTGLVLLRYLFCYLHSWICLRNKPHLSKVKIYRLAQILQIFKEGGWYSVSNIIGPIMVYFDRFFISLLVPASQIAYYTTPLEIVNRMLVIPASLSRTLFPTFTMYKNSARSEQLFRKSLSALIAIMAPLAIGSTFVAKTFFSIWLGNQFADHSASIFIILVWGVVINSMAWIPFTLIQSFGHPNVTAKVHLIELPFYIGGLFLLTKHFGMTGTAVAWSMRNLVDLFILLAVARRYKNRG